MSPSEPGSEAVGPPDRYTLRLLDRRLAGDDLVESTVFDPDDIEPRVLRARLETDRYPPPTTRAILDVRWFVGDDFSIHYREETGGEHWECRWDRHPNPHADRLHFHCPPDCESVESLDLESTHPLDVCSTVLAALEERIDEHWRREG